MIKNNYENKTNIFLLEQQTPKLLADNGRAPYRLSKDKKALEIIKEKAINVDVLIFFLNNDIDRIVEIIDIAKINELIDRGIDYQNVISGRLIIQKVLVGADK